MADVSQTQRALNAFADRYLEGFAHVIVDGRKGAATRTRIRLVKYFLGYAGTAAKQNAVIDDAFSERLWHPKDPRYSTAARIGRGMARRSKQRRDWRKNHRAAKTKGVGTFDGVPVANAAIAYLTWARKRGWRGRLVSGWRDPKYSQSLCMRMCGAPSCPGRCAGLASNHVGSNPDRFAIDVSDYARFGQLMRLYPGRKIFNALGAADPVHFSPSGR